MIRKFIILIILKCQGLVLDTICEAEYGRLKIKENCGFLMVPKNNIFSTFKVKRTQKFVRGVSDGICSSTYDYKKKIIGTPKPQKQRNVKISQKKVLSQFLFKNNLKTITKMILN
jgi:hypothetical protein